MEAQAYVLEATDVVLSWDLPDSALADAIVTELQILARIAAEG
jgi:hypothetical protein